MSREGRKIDDRDRNVIICLVVGTLSGALAGLLLGWLIDPEMGVILGPLIGAAIGQFSGLLLSRVLTASESNRRVVARHVLWGVRIGTLVGCLIGIAVVWGMVTAGEGIPITLIRTGAVIVLFMGIGAFIGLLSGYEAAKTRERIIRRGIVAHFFHPSLPPELVDSDEPHRVLENALIEKFGSLDDAQRERIRTWDADRVAEAMRKLPTASSLDDLE